MNHWIALSDQPPVTAQDAGAGLLPRGRLVAEIDMPLAGAGVLLDFRQGEGAGEVALSLFHDLGAGLALLHRQGGRLMRHMLPGPLLQRTGVARMEFCWDVSAGRWSLELAQEGRRVLAQGQEAMAPRLADLRALCAGGAGVMRHPAMLWFGVMAGDALPAPAAWLGPATPVMTARGPVAAGSLRPGDRVITRDEGPVTLLGVTRLVVPGRGSMAPIRLRAPYFGQRGDLLVAPDQPVLVTGPDAEYLFGEDEVLVLARHLADGQMALADGRRALALGVVPDLGAAHVIEADGCLLATAGRPGLGPARRLLEAFEALPLRSALVRAQQRAI